MRSPRCLCVGASPTAGAQSVSFRRGTAHTYVQAAHAVQAVHLEAACALCCASMHGASPLYYTSPFPLLGSQPMHACMHAPRACAPCMRAPCASPPSAASRPPRAPVLAGSMPCAPQRGWRRGSPPTPRASQTLPPAAHRGRHSTTQSGTAQHVRHAMMGASLPFISMQRRPATHGGQMQAVSLQLYPKPCAPRACLVARSCARPNGQRWQGPLDNPNPRCSPT